MKKDKRKYGLIIFIILFAAVTALIFSFIIYPNLIHSEKTEIFVPVCESYSIPSLQNDIFEGDYSDEEMGDYQISFEGNIDEFSSISIGKNNVLNTILTIDKEYISIYCQDKLSEQFKCDLPINKNIKILISTDLKNNAKIEVSSNGNSQIIENVNWSSRWGKLFVEAGENTSLNNCILRYNCSGWNKSIWLLGDSYFNCVASERWTSYLTQNDYDNFLLNGYAGRNSDAALDSLKVMLQYNTPKEIIWCLGMNDGDSDSGINDSYFRDVEELKKICEEKNIELILSTVPSCPMVNNDFKNQYVKESGYRYIDFAEAVGSYEDIFWYPGMLEDTEKPIHPTSEGAFALYNKAVSVCPELLNK